MGFSPTDLASQAKSPETGCISRFFQISALTVGITKKGAMTMRRTMPTAEEGLVEEKGHERCRRPR